MHFRTVLVAGVTDQESSAETSLRRGRAFRPQKRTGVKRLPNACPVKLSAA